ncbi:cGMP-dependent kinase 1-like, partial [Paramuricea clavata]
GKLEVTKDGEVLGEMSSGTAFGELAILYNCKRTASYIPMPVLYGLFIYMGVSALKGVQEEPGYETVPTVVREFYDDVNTNANNSAEDTSAEGLYEEVGVPSDAHGTSGYETPGQIEAYEEPKMSQENSGYTELDKNRLQGRNTTDDNNYQKLQRRDSDYVIPAHERRESYEDIKMGRNLPGYEALDQSKREADEYTPLTKSGQKPELA